MFFGNKGFEFFHAGDDLLRESLGAAEDYFGGFIFHYFADGLLVGVEGEVILMLPDFINGHEERLVCAGALCFPFRIVEA